MAEVSFYVNLDEHKIQAHHDRQDWIDQFRAEHDLDLGDDADWNDIYRTIAMDHLAGGEYAEYVTGQGWDVETDAEKSAWDDAMPDCATERSTGVRCLGHRPVPACTSPRCDDEHCPTHA